MKIHLSCLMSALLAACSSSPSPSTSPTPTPTPTPRSAPQAQTYWLYVANESSDLISRIAFTPGTGVRVDAKRAVGNMPADIDGPHGLAVSPDGRTWYVTTAHGTPYGRVWKYNAGTDSVLGRAELGNFPASLTVTPDGQFLYVVNFNLHGDPVPSSVSIVYTPTMTEVARPVTCVMPHGSRLNAAGTKHYSTCMHSDQLVEIDTRTFHVTQRVGLAPGHEGALPLTDAGKGMQHTGSRVCSPTWAQPGRATLTNRVYVACNKSNEVLEVDPAAGSITRRFATGKGPYNLAVTPDGKLLVITLKGEQGVQIIDLLQAREVGRVATTQPVTHGVVVSPDGAFAFVTNEAIGSTRGTVDVIDLRSMQRVASVALEFQPGGIDFWRVSR